MAGAIKGITIEFRGETTRLQSALAKMSAETKKFDKELKYLNKDLKLKPTSIELWSQKQQILTQRIKETKRNLDELKTAKAKMDADPNVDKQSEEYRRLQREIVECEAELKSLNSELRNIGNANLRALGEQFKEIGAKVTEAGKAMSKYITAPIAGIYAASAKSALSYGDAIAKVSTIADESQVPIDTLKKNIINLSNETGKGANELAEATYQALSASIETKDVSKFVAEATNLAKAGFLDTADAVDVLTTIINAYGYSAQDATLIADQLVQTQNDGKTTVNELAQAMGQVIPTASALNIPLEQLNASYVLLTKQGINTANATTYLNGMFTELSRDGSEVSEILQAKTGKSFGQLMKDGYSLGDILQILSDSVNGDSEAFSNLWGNTRAGRGALALLNAGADEFNSEAEKMANSTGNVNEALGKLKTPGAEARKALNMLLNVGIQIGDVLAPYIGKAAEFIQKLIDKFNQLSPATQKALVIFGAILAAIGPLLVGAGTLISSIGQIMIVLGKLGPVITFIKTAITAVVGIVGSAGAIFLAVAAVIGVAAYMIYKHWDQIKAKAQELWANIKAVWDGIKQNISDAVSNIVSTVTAKWNALKSTASSLWNQIKTAVTTPINTLKATLSSAWASIQSRASSAWNTVKSAITNPINTAKALVKSAVDKIKSYFPFHIGKIMSGLKLPHFKITGKFSLNPPSTPHIGVSWYAKGGIFDAPSVIGVGEAGPEAVVPLNKLWDKLDAMQSGTFNCVININGTDKDKNEIADEVRRVLIEEVKRRRLAWQ